MFPDSKVVASQPWSGWPSVDLSVMDSNPSTFDSQQPQMFFTKHDQNLEKMHLPESSQQIQTAQIQISH